ncbi:YceI family protein [Ulvibacter antarcticus]|uniref:YceI-like domain-containing protein n=1 Tax=Ulvibacter antarcticus TaxID=442714 RepID=A0A3L9YU71_9FLAO|nr:YceI family protein [Ulvibacter antarcticus]RMA64301.1 YceI-like domain-containing protein [Ulvibacter antarcticus]
MKTYLLLISCVFSFPLFAQTIKINESEATIKFVFVEDDVDGTLSDFKFTGIIDLDDLENSNFSGSVATETIDTNNWFRNRHLRNKYFKYEEFPRLFFKSTKIQGNGKEFLVKGTLTIKGISKPVTFTFHQKPTSFYATTMINAAHYDININKEDSRNMVQVMITLPFTAN